MNPNYEPNVLEKAAQSAWESDNRYVALEQQDGATDNTYYCLSMLPYPSGQLHMGHVRNYTLGDVLARYETQRGKNVLHPMGWDAFGLPAENAAIKNKVSPHDWTQSNIASMREQFKRMGYSFDWSREIATCNPDYYRWEQWFFTKLFERGIAYKKDALVNWDPVDQTVLANEQVVNGRGWRSGALVEQKKISQWFLKITDYSQELLDGLDDLDGWPDEVRRMQRNWIGRSTGSTISFAVEDADPLKIYTTRADTLFGVSFLAIAADHPLALAALAKDPSLAEFTDSCKQQSVAEADLAKQEKRGVNSGFTATHPLTNKLLPIWITNYVLSTVGTGAVMAVPAHDQRDFDFAQKHNLRILPVIDAEDWDYASAAYTGSGKLIKSGDFSGSSCEKARIAITEQLQLSEQGYPCTNYRLRDWGISRQRYWGTPIPIIYCDDCGAVPVPDADLPVRLPTDLIPNAGESVLKSCDTFYRTTCPNCKKLAVRETDTMDTFVESSWYYARYCCPDQHDAMLDDRAKHWTPVNQYIGGVEHAVMHLLYARFMHKMLRDVGLVDSNEPFEKLLTQGMVLKDGHKMSKSKGNVVAPEPLIERYGVDTVRLFIMFAAPPHQDLEWSDSGVQGSHRFLKRLWQLVFDFQDRLKAGAGADIAKDAASSAKQLRREAHSILKQAHYDMNRQQINTVVSAAMKLYNHLSAGCEQADMDAATLSETLRILLLLLTPFVPHLSEHLWGVIGYEGDVHKTAWPQPDEQALVVDEVEYVVQINGKLRARLPFATGADEATIRTEALAAESLQTYLAGKEVKRVIIIPKKLVNIVVA